MSAAARGRTKPSPTLSPQSSDLMDVPEPPEDVIAISSPYIQEYETTDNRIPVIQFCEKTDAKGNLITMSVADPLTSIQITQCEKNNPAYKYCKRYYTGGPPTCMWNGCNTVFESADELADHVRKVHDVNNLPKGTHCQWTGCNVVCEEKFLLITHLRNHTNERPEMCDFPGCGKAFKLASRLKIHKRTHTGERPFDCSFPGCSSSFADPSDRAKHENRIHATNKKYPCYVENCKKKYTDPSSLRKHVISAHGRTSLRQGPGPIIQFTVRRLRGKIVQPVMEDLCSPDQPQQQMAPKDLPTENHPLSIEKMLSATPTTSFQSSCSAFRAVPQRTLPDISQLTLLAAASQNHVAAERAALTASQIAPFTISQNTHLGLQRTPMMPTALNALSHDRYLDELSKMAMIQSCLPSIPRYLPLSPVVEKFPKSVVDHSFLLSQLPQTLPSMSFSQLPILQQPVFNVPQISVSQSLLPGNELLSYLSL